jgi:hypothetical protein
MLLSFSGRLARRATVGRGQGNRQCFALKKPIGKGWLTGYIVMPHL